MVSSCLNTVSSPRKFPSASKALTPRALSSSAFLGSTSVAMTPLNAVAATSELIPASRRVAKAASNSSGSAPSPSCLNIPPVCCKSCCTSPTSAAEVRAKDARRSLISLDENPKILAAIWLNSAACTSPVPVASDRLTTPANWVSTSLELAPNWSRVFAAWATSDDVFVDSCPSLWISSLTGSICSLLCPDNAANFCNSASSTAKLLSDPPTMLRGSFSNDPPI